MLSFWNNHEYKAQLEAEKRTFAFLQAAAEGDLSTFQTYIEQGMDINSVISATAKIDIAKFKPTSAVRHNTTALVLAIQNARASIVQYILYINTENTNLVHSENIDFLINLVLESEIDDISALDEITLMLLDKHKISEPQLICKIAQRCLNNSVAKLLKLGISPNTTYDFASINADPSKPITALGFAILYNNLPLANILLEHQADITKCTSEKTLEHTFELCLKNAGLTMLELLYSSLSAQQQKSLNIINLIHLALRMPEVYQQDIILQLAHKLTDDELTQDSKQEYNLLFAAAKHGCIELMQHLINRGIKPDIVNPSDQTALFYARKPDIDTFHPLQQLHVCNYFATHKQFEDSPKLGAMVSLLVMHGLDINHLPKSKCDLPPIAHAIINHLDAAVVAFIEHNAILDYNWLDFTYLSNSIPLSPSLLNLYVNLSLNTDAFIPANCPFAQIGNVVYKIEHLHGSLITLAAISNNAFALEALLKTDKLSEQQKNIFVNQIVNHNTQQTLLMFLALMCGDSHYEVTRILVNYGANVYAKNKKGWTAYDLALKTENYDIANLFGARMAMREIHGLLHMTKRTLVRLATLEFDEHRIIHARPQIADVTPQVPSETAMVVFNPDQHAIVAYQRPANRF